MSDDQDITLDDLAARFPAWHCWEGVGGLWWYGRLPRTSPPIVARAATARELAREIEQRIGGLR